MRGWTHVSQKLNICAKKHQLEQCYDKNVKELSKGNRPKAFESQSFAGKYTKRQQTLEKKAKRL